MGGRVLGLLGIAFFAIMFFGLGLLFHYLGLIDMDLSDPLRPSDRNQFLALFLPSLVITIIALVVVGRILGIDRGGGGGNYGGGDLDGGDWGDGGSDGGGGDVGGS
ncbi:MAG: hypothetical protein LC781_02095 [Actinobacteria bacterium]|nr:hypothetical protein [Actinomycetota bacterium]